MYQCVFMVISNSLLFIVHSKHLITVHILNCIFYTCTVYDCVCKKWNLLHSVCYMLCMHNTMDSHSRHDIVHSFILLAVYYIYDQHKQYKRHVTKENNPGYFQTVTVSVVARVSLIHNETFT